MNTLVHTGFMSPPQHCRVFLDATPEDTHESRLTSRRLKVLGYKKMNDRKEVIQHASCTPGIICEGTHRNGLDVNKAHVAHTLTMGSKWS